MYREANNPIVGFIDDGVSNIASPTLIYDMETSQGVTGNRTTAVKDMSHGSICASIFSHYAPNASLASILILDSVMQRGNIRDLCASINWCIHQKIKIVNLSLGTVSAEDIDQLRDICQQASDEGIVIISACKNYSNFSWPASFDCVIGVKSDNSLYDCSKYGVHSYPNGGIEFSACGTHVLGTDRIMPSSTVGPSNSYSAPIITAHVYSLVVSNPKLHSGDIKQLLLGKLGISSIKNSSEQLTHYSFTNSKLDIPLVILWGDEAVVVMNELMIGLRTIGYFPSLFTEKQLNYCQNEWTYVNNVCQKDQCFGMAKFYDADLILFLVDSKKKHTGMDKADVGFVCGTDEPCDWICDSIKSVNEHNALDSLLALIGPSE